MSLVEFSNLKKSFREARQITRQHAKSFYFASLALPKNKKKAAYSVYAFCRYVDDSMDKAIISKNKTEISYHLIPMLNRLYEGDFSDNLTWAEAFHTTVKVYKIPKNYFEDLIEGVKLDVQPSVQIQTWGELKNYCYYVASVVGLIMSYIFGIKDQKAQEPAIALGMAMQLTNILRDVKEDYQNQRVYLPAEELLAYQIDLKAGFKHPNWKKYANFFCHRAKQYYQVGEKGIHLLARDGSQFTVWLMRWIYAEILNEIENHNYDVSHRHHVNFFKKLKLVFKTYKSYKESSL